MIGYLIDTSVLIAQYEDKLPRSQVERVESSHAAISTISIFEFNKFLRNEGKLQDWEEIRLILARYTVIPPDFETCELAGELANSKGLSTADSLIYATALQNDYRLLTRDSDFDKMEKVEVI